MFSCEPYTKSPIVDSSPRSRFWYHEKVSIDQALLRSGVAHWRAHTAVALTPIPACRINETLESNHSSPKQRGRTRVCVLCRSSNREEDWITVKRSDALQSRLKAEAFNTASTLHFNEWSVRCPDSSGRRAAIKPQSQLAKTKHNTAANTTKKSEASPRSRRFLRVVTLIITALQH